MKSTGKIVQALEKYLQEALGLKVEVLPFAQANGLPQYLRERYRLFKMNVFGTDCLVVADAGEEEQTPAVIGKHLDQLRSRFQWEVVYVRQAVTSYNRKRLIEQKVSFIIPGNQMYLPLLGIDLREHMRRLRETKPVFSPSTQMLVLHVLWRKTGDILTPAEIANRLGYSPMTMTRAFDELETAGIGEHSVLGKERRLRFAETGEPLWERVLPFLVTPVRRRFFIATFIQKEEGQMAGQSALARYTMLAEPNIPVRAFSAGEWKVRNHQIKIAELTFPEPGGTEIELWKYAPAPFAQEGMVDRLSLYLSLKESANERVQFALDNLLGGMKW